MWGKELVNLKMISSFAIIIRVLMTISKSSRHAIKKVSHLMNLFKSTLNNHEVKFT